QVRVERAAEERLDRGGRPRGTTRIAAAPRGGDRAARLPDVEGLERLREGPRPVFPVLEERRERRAARVDVHLLERGDEVAPAPRRRGRALRAGRDLRRDALDELLE